MNGKAAARCSSCGKVVSLPRELLGTSVTCPLCFTKGARLEEVPDEMMARQELDGPRPRSRRWIWLVAIGLPLMLLLILALLLLFFSGRGPGRGGDAPGAQGAGPTGQVPGRDGGGPPEPPEPPPPKGDSGSGAPSSTDGGGGETSTQPTEGGTGSGSGSGGGGGGGGEGEGEPVEPEPPPVKVSQSDKAVWEAAKKAVRVRLKKPALAKFPQLGVSGTSVKEAEDGYVAEGYVDAVNDLGDVIRTRFRCELAHAHGSNKLFPTAVDFVE